MGKSKDLATGETRFVNTAGDTMSGDLGINGDLTVDTNALFVDASANKVGINTTTLNNALNVESASYTALGIKRNTGVTTGTGELGIHMETNSQTTVCYDDEGSFVFGTAGTPSTAAGFSEKVRIDSSGRMKVPNTPAFHAKGLANSASAGGTANGNEVLLFNGITYNNGSHYNASNGRFTAPCAGIYYFSYSLLYDNSFNNAGSAMLRKNASGAGEYGYVEGSNVDYMQVTASAVVSCSTGDYVDVYSYPAGWHIASESSFTGFMIG